MTKKFDREYLMEELGLPYNSVETTLVDSGRWTLTYELIFQDKDGKYWQTYYQTGATEMQYEPPWECEPKVECVEVEKRPVTIEKWMPVDKP